MTKSREDVLRLIDEAGVRYILLYVTWAFRRMPKPFHYGTCAIIALVHDAVIALGVFSILGAIFNWQIDMAFIVGILSVIG